MRLPLVCLAAALSASMAMGADLKPVDASMLDGTKLTSSEQKFSIEAPAGWPWWSSSAPDGRVMYVCRRGAKDGPPFMVTVGVEPTPSRSRMSASEAQSFIEGLIGSLKQAGETDISSERKPSSQPVPGSHRITLASTTAKGDHHRLYLYVGRRTLVYAIQVIISDSDKDGPAELEQFEKFVASFHAL